MARVPLGGNGSDRCALVDDADLEFVIQYSWHLDRYGYAVHSRRSVRPWTLPMHRLLLGLDGGDPRLVDHINSDRLDNRRANLRIVSHRENSQNRKACGKSGRRGVTWNKQSGKWQARVRLGDRYHYLGLFDDLEDAAQTAAEFRAIHMPGSIEALRARGMAA